MMLNLTQWHLLYKQFMAWSCNGSSVAPLSVYMNNPIFHEITDEDDYFGLRSDKRIYLNLRVTSGYAKEQQQKIN